MLTYFNTQTNVHDLQFQTTDGQLLKNAIQEWKYTDGQNDWQDEESSWSLSPCWTCAYVGATVEGTHQPTAHLPQHPPQHLPQQPTLKSSHPSSHLHNTLYMCRLLAYHHNLLSNPCTHHHIHRTTYTLDKVHLCSLSLQSTQLCLCKLNWPQLDLKCRLVSTWLQAGTHICRLVSRYNITHEIQTKQKT